MTIENAYGFFAWDVAAYLGLALVIMLVVAVVDRLFFAPKIHNENHKNSFWQLFYFAGFLKFNKNEGHTDRPKIVQWSVELYPVLLLVFVLRGFVIEPFRIPSNSMMPTLLTGDFILVNKFNYGIRLPILNTKIIPVQSPKRGDVIVFRYPNYEQSPTYKGADFIKRIIGLPGDKISYQNDRLKINGKAIDYRNLGTYLGVESGISMSGFKHKRELLNEPGFEILLAPNQASKPIKIQVPAGHYLVMGDNRARSSDSRFWGFVPESYIIGKAFGIWMHWDKSVKFERVGGFD